MSSNVLNQGQEERARKNHSLIMQRLASVGNAAVALAIGVDESTVSRMKTDKLLELATILSVLDLKVVPASMKIFDEKTVEVLLYGHQQWVNSIESAHQLEGE
jgi:hypothetical protein